jgi:hypothetical protein
MVMLIYDILFSMGCPVCQKDMIKSKVGYLCLNCGNLVTHGHSALKPEHHEEHLEAETAKSVAKKPAPARKVAVKTRTVSDIKRKAHSQN